MENKESQGQLLKNALERERAQRAQAEKRGEVSVLDQGNGIALEALEKLSKAVDAGKIPGQGAKLQKGKLLCLQAMINRLLSEYYREGGTGDVSNVE
jgi:hypothetical protein